MGIFAIGDVQGCYDKLQKLLDVIQFDDKKDTLWFTGDLVNRGKQSLLVLRFIKSLGSTHKIVLGNHDLHLLAVALNASKPKIHDTIFDILSAKDKDDLIDWLRNQTLFYYDEKMGYALVHAGLSPDWDIHLANQLSDEITSVLNSDKATYFLKNMYGNLPNKWRNNLTGIERWRCITNYFTRMRYCYKDGSLMLSYKGPISGKPSEVIPWYEVPNRKNYSTKIIFGHWAALNGIVSVPNLFALDTGCVWGNSLTALRLSDEKTFSISCQE